MVNPVNKNENVGIPRHAIGIKYMPFIDYEQTDGLRYWYKPVPLNIIVDLLVLDIMQSTVAS